MKLLKLTAGLLLPAALAIPLLLADTKPATAGDPCESWWYQRNAIYARNGYCFQTQRARAVFGRGCFPPYGKLSAFEQREVNRLKAKERGFGCTIN